jgi:hypothetical protein
MSSCSLSYLDGVYDCAAMISCGSDAVTDPVAGWIITPLPHDIAQSLTSPYLNCNQSICRCCRRRFDAIPFCFKLFSPLEMRSTLGVYARIVVSIGNEGHKSSSASAVTINTLEVVECHHIFLGGRWPDELGSLVIRG